MVKRIKHKSSELRVLMVISQFYPIIGGAEKQAQLLSQTLIKKGINVQIVTGQWQWGTPRKERIDGIPVYRKFCFWGMFGIKGIRTLGVLTFMISLAIHLILHRSTYDLIHVHQALYPAFVSTLIGKGLLRKPIIVKSASSGETNDIKLLEKFPFGRLQRHYLLNDLDYLVSINRISSMEYTNMGVPESKIIWIPNGVSCQAEPKQVHDRAQQVLTITRLSQEKGIDILLKAWTQVRIREEEVRLTIVGDGPLRKQLLKMSETLGLGNSVSFLGMKEDVSKDVEMADLFVLPSRSEGMSNALLEAMSYGLPCVATKVGANPELLQVEGIIERGKFLVGENGLIVNPDDPEGLSEAMLHMIRNPGERKRFGMKGYQFVGENFSIGSVAERYIQLYQRALRHRI